MTTALRSRSFLRSLALAATPLLLALGLVLPGCATSREVAQIVANSNAAMLAGRFEQAGLPGAAPGAGAQAVQQEYDRIEAFIAAHQEPQFLDTTTPLRLRQAVLLLNNGQTSLAKAAFAQVDASHLHTARDQALKRSERTLLWWFANSTKENWTDTDRQESKAALAQLQSEQEALGDSPDIRDYLAEMRAWIGIVAAKHTTEENKVRAFLVDALDAYAKIFTADDLQAVAAPATPAAGQPVLGPEMRRRLRAPAVLEQARTINKALGDRGAGTHVATPVFDAWIHRP